jgi:hypothetical protein
LNGSKTSMENWSKTLLLLLPKKLGISDIFFFSLNLKALKIVMNVLIWN